MLLFIKDGKSINPLDHVGDVVSVHAQDNSYDVLIESIKVNDDGDNVAVNLVEVNDKLKPEEEPCKCTVVCSGNSYEITTDEFSESGCLLLVNQLLHAFGFAIARDTTKVSSELIVLRTKFRGFSDESMVTGYTRIAEYMKKNADSLLDDMKEEEATDGLPKSED